MLFCVVWTNLSLKENPINSIVEKMMNLVLKTCVSSMKVVVNQSNTVQIDYLLSKISIKMYLIY